MQYFILIPHKNWGLVYKANAKIENLRIVLDMVLQCGIIQMSQIITFVFPIYHCGGVWNRISRQKLHFGTIPAA